MKSWYSLTLSEVNSRLTNLEKPLVSMDLHELLRNVHACEDRASPFAVDSASVLIQRQAGLVVAAALTGQTVDQLWREIQLGLGRHDEESRVLLTLGETTLEDFLAQAKRFVVPPASCSYKFGSIGLSKMQFDSFDSPSYLNLLSGSSSSPSIDSVMMQSFSDQFGGSSSESGFDYSDPIVTQNYTELLSGSSSSPLISESSYSRQFGGSSSFPSIGTSQTGFDSFDDRTKNYLGLLGGSSSFPSMSSSQTGFDSFDDRTKNYLDLLGGSSSAPSIDAVMARNYSRQFDGSSSFPSIGTSQTGFDSFDPVTKKKYLDILGGPSSGPSIDASQTRLDSNNSVMPNSFSHQFDGSLNWCEKEMQFHSFDSVLPQSYLRQLGGSSSSPLIGKSQMRLNSTDTVPPQSLPRSINTSKMRLDLTNAVMPQSSWIQFRGSSSAPSIGSSQPQSSTLRSGGLPPLHRSTITSQTGLNSTGRIFSHPSNSDMSETSSQTMNEKPAQSSSVGATGTKKIRKKNPVTVMKNRESAERFRQRELDYVTSLEKQIKDEKEKISKFYEETVTMSDLNGGYEAPESKLRRTRSF